MANYGVKYTCSFDPFTDDVDVYRLDILQKDYTGSATNIKGGATPVVQEWQTDDPKSPIKGSSLNITLLNEGQLPLDSFFSVNDDEFQVILYYKTNVLFVGFIVQDDCMETMVDFTHELTLSATDNLGLLKDLALSKADNAFAYTSVGEQNIATFEPHTLRVPPVVGAQVQPGDTIKIESGDAQSATPYTVLTVENDTSYYTIVFNEEIVSYSGPAILEIGKLDLLNKKPLIQIIGMCLGLTSLNLRLYVWGQINETSQAQAESFLTQTLIDPQTFMNDDGTYMDCYTVLTYLFSAFNFTLFQSNGAWHMVRWDELRYYKNRMTAFVFNSDLTLYGYSIMRPPFQEKPFDPTIENTNYPLNGLLRRVLRPFSFVKETFNYREPPQLLRNYDLKTLGTLLRTYNVDVWLWDGQVFYSYDDAVDAAPSGAVITKTFEIYREYSMPWWYSKSTDYRSHYFIRVISDSIDNEISRQVVLNTDISSYQIEVNKGDIFKFTFSFKTEKSQTGGNGIGFLVYLTNGITQNGYYTTPEGWATWDPLRGYVYEVLAGDNTNVWHTVTIDTTFHPIPFDGLLSIGLSNADLASNFETKKDTYYKDLSFDYSPLVNDSTRITGQYHNNEQTQLIKNNLDIEINVDTSPRNSICGTLFLNQLEGILQKRASQFGHPYLTGQSENLGKLVTEEELFWRQKPRSILDGSFYGLTSVETVPYGCALQVQIDPLAGTESVTFTFTSTPPGTTGVTVSYFNGKWNDSAGDTTSPKTLDITAGNYVFRITFVGAGITYYFTPDTQHFSMLSVLNFDQIPGVNTVPGTLSIDFKNNKFTGTLYEMYSDQDTELNSTYTFNYIYKPV